MTRKGTRGYYRGWRCFQKGQGRPHPQPVNISESRVLPALRDEAARLRVPATHVEAEQANERELGQLDQRRSVLLDALERSIITPIEAQTRLAAVQAERERVERSAVLLPVAQSIDWSLPTEKLHNALAALWQRVDVDLATGAVDVTWTVPEWRA